MIQRIQTLFLLIASMLLFLGFFTPLAKITITNPNDIISLYPYKMVSMVKGESATTLFLVNGIMLGVAAILGVINIFNYKKRKLQMLFCVITAILIFVTCNLSFLLILTTMSSTNASISYNIISVFPIIALVLVYLAYRAINKDEKLIKSINRIR